MTRAEELLQLISEVDLRVGQPKPFKNPQNVFMKQYVKYSPGQKTPRHIKLRNQKKRNILTRSRATYTRPWKSSDKPTRDTVSAPLDKKYKEISVKRTG